MGVSNCSANPLNASSHRLESPHIHAVSLPLPLLLLLRVACKAEMR